jgi:hypothetical protein
VVCDGDACLIAGSETNFKKYLQIANQPHSANVIIEKTRFCEILRGLLLGAAYSFDETAYAKFYPLAKKALLDVSKPNFNGNPGKEIEFITVRMKGTHNQAL